MATNQKPIIGSDIHFVNAGHSLGTYSSTCRAAKVTDIKTESELSAVVFTPKGSLFYDGLTHDEGRAGGTWHWPHPNDDPSSSILPVNYKPPATPSGSTGGKA